MFETAETETHLTTEYIFETEAPPEETKKEFHLSGGFIFFVVLLFIIGISITVLIKKRKKNKEEQRKKDIKINSVNAKFLKKKQEINDNLDKYAANLLSKYDFHDEGDDPSEPIEFRDLLADRDNKPEEDVGKETYNSSNSLYDFIDNDAETIKYNKAKNEKIQQLREEIDNGISDDIDDYFSRQNNFNFNNDCPENQLLPEMDEEEWDENYDVKPEDDDIDEYIESKKDDTAILNGNIDDDDTEILNDSINDNINVPEIKEDDDNEDYFL